MDMNRTRTGPGMWTAEEDVIETLPDGRTIQVATKGTEMPMADAVRLGLVKDGAAARPSETKVEAPAETKATPPTKADEAEADAEDAESDVNDAPAKAAAKAGTKNGGKK